MTRFKKLNRLIGLRTESDLKALDRVATEAFGANSHVAEVGSFVGESTLRLSEHCFRVDAIDPWTNQSIQISLTGASNPSVNVLGEVIAKTMDASLIEMVFDENTKTRKNINKFKGNYWEYEDVAKVDCVYIDAVHTHDFTYNCIKFFLSEGRNVRVMAGHDYCEYWPGVVSAVNELLGQPDRLFEDNSWVKFL